MSRAAKRLRDALGRAPKRNGEDYPTWFVFGRHPATGRVDIADSEGDVATDIDIRNAELILAMLRDLPALLDECDALRAHYDAAGPEHNLLALLDLYEERRREACAEADALRAELAAKCELEDEVEGA